MRWWWIPVLAAAVVAGGYLLLTPQEDTVPNSGPIALSMEERTLLLRLARDSLAAHLEGRSPSPVDEALLTPAVHEVAACFVTLTKGGALRGCILDSFRAHEPIYKNVQRNAILAATVDNRFPAVRAAELPTLRIEISVLGSPYPLEFSGPDDLLRRLRPGIDGVTLTTSYGTATFLPQVWEELSDPQVFLGELCRKHGAPRDAWRTAALLRVEVYQANHFSEAEPAESD
ncbi:MAG: AmmeMemoRadiSam system protein A [Candidatus Bipolaricaulis sp.]|nr:AmmeMemoRadiSam system protein A [Candidatus Bipolaricaulis sp.]